MRTGEQYSVEERDLIVACALRMRHIAERPAPPKWQTWSRRDHDDEVQYGPRYQPSQWFVGEGGERMPEKYRTRYVRACHKLEARGVLEITTSGGRLAHVKLTAEGVKISDELVPPEKPKRAKKAKGKPAAVEPVPASPDQEQAEDEVTAAPDAGLEVAADPVPLASDTEVQA
ncbi:hypothetical protein [Gemmata sp.]|uniref:hypothetical protein n=1 Tax=Gemmata sp. TaxID=1914242 RepID=UPI003F6F016A